MKHLKTQNQLNEASENLNISDVRQRFIDLVDDRIKSLEREMNYTKQGQEFYDKLQERIDELTDLLSDMRNVV
jgi:chemotaxis regulatin CheY-phosphate phosphatase CheZ